MSSRTEELIAAGSNRMGAPPSDGDGLVSTPFVAWPPDGPAWIEGKVTELWEGQYGKNATITITGFTPGLGGKEGPPFVEGGGANIGLSSASLRDTIDESHIGNGIVHVAFLGWSESKGGNRYRRFTVLEVLDDSPQAVAATPKPDDGLPF